VLNDPDILLQPNTGKSC